MEARKTEYNGIVFRSKSEAILARCFDLHGYRWLYEPFSYGGHVWDFWVDCIVKNDVIGVMVDDVDNDGWCWQAIDATVARHFLIEYKPARPTDAYIENLRKCWDSCRDRGSNPPMVPLIVYGTPYEEISSDLFISTYWSIDIRKSVSGQPCNCSEFWTDIPLLDDAARKARSYRFDLRQAV